MVTLSGKYILEILSFWCNFFTKILSMDCNGFFFGEKVLKIHQKGKFTLIFYRFNLAFDGY
jgi:hypothetical protein